MNYKFKETMWIYPGPAAWHFINVPIKHTKQIKNTFGHLARGFGSLPVNVNIGTSSWKTSIFPDNKNQTYLLPIKVSVRKKEGLKAGQKITINITILAD